MARNKFIVFVWLISMQSCRKSPDDQGYVAWVRDYSNGMHAQTETDNLIMDVQYQPAEYLWIQRNGNFDEKKFRVDQPELDRIQHFILTIGTKTGTDFIAAQARDLAEKQRLTYYFSYLFQNDITLEQDGQFLPCVLFHFERNVDLNNQRIFVLGFENDKKNGPVKLIFNSPQLSGLPIKIEVLKQNKSFLNLCSH